MKLVEKLIEVRLLSDGFIFGVLYLNFGPAANSHTEEDLCSKDGDQSDCISIKLKASLDCLSFLRIFRRKRKSAGSSAKELASLVDRA